MNAAAAFTTGLPNLDAILNGILPGDNIVFHVESVDQYRPLVEPYGRAALSTGQRLAYFRFAGHSPLLPPDVAASVHTLNPEQGFEAFVARIHRVIDDLGTGGYYLFDCLSELAEIWLSDQMLANFFVLTCPYLYDVGAVASFSLRRQYHAEEAVVTIHATAQVHLDVFTHGGALFVRPTKAQHRYSATMFLLHQRQGDEFVPVAHSGLLTRIMAPVQRLQAQPAGLKGLWNRAFLRAMALDPAAADATGKDDELRERLLRMAISRDSRVLALARRYFTVADLADLRGRLIGSGLIGGKAVGMLLARRILLAEAADLADYLEPHDSFFVGADVYYTFLVMNGIWWMREPQPDIAALLRNAHRARQRIVVGEFPDYILDKFQEMLDYFGQSPIIVRSSSLLEDNFGNAFAGTYESVFCANQGPRERRFEDFLSAVRTIYASSLSNEALTYRAKRGLLQRDEQMALLVQRVSGNVYGDHFLPQAAGVGFSHNPYAWSELIEPRAGVVRLVFGLGTRAVDRVEDDDIRVIALNAPERRLDAADEHGLRTQRYLDAIDLRAGHLATVPFAQVEAACSEAMPLELFASRDRTGSRSGGQAPLVLTFTGLLRQTSFVGTMKRLLSVLQSAYENPVDVEFTINFDQTAAPDAPQYALNVVQCRPLQIKGSSPIAAPPIDLNPDHVLFQAAGTVVGQSRIDAIDVLVYVRPETYSQLAQHQRHAVARRIERLVHTAQADSRTVLLLGPGRWGTSMPSLGVPLSRNALGEATAICEVAAMHAGLVPDVSLGTHFFSEIVEQDILYCAVFPGRQDNFVNVSLLEARSSSLSELAEMDEHTGTPQYQTDVVTVLDGRQLPSGQVIRLYADTVARTAICYLDDAVGQG